MNALLIPFLYTIIVFAMLYHGRMNTASAKDERRMNEGSAKDDEGQYHNVSKSIVLYNSTK
jgi:hypothetical protein